MSKQDHNTGSRRWLRHRLLRAGAAAGAAVANKKHGRITVSTQSGRRSQCIRRASCGLAVSGRLPHPLRDAQQSGLSSGDHGHSADGQPAPARHRPHPYRGGAGVGSLHRLRHHGQGRSASSLHSNSRSPIPRSSGRCSRRLRSRSSRPARRCWSMPSYLVDVEATTMQKMILAFAALMGSWKALEAAQSPALPRRRRRQRLQAVHGRRCCCQSPWHGRAGPARHLGPRLAPQPDALREFLEAQLRKPASIMPPYTALVLSEAQVADIYAYAQQPAGPRRSPRTSRSCMGHLGLDQAQRHSNGAGVQLRMQGLRELMTLWIGRDRLSHASVMPSME